MAREECGSCWFTRTGAVCPECGETVDRIGEGFMLTQGRIWGTDAVPVYNEGLGQFTSGKADADRKAAELGLRHRDKGEPRRKSKHEIHKRTRKRIRPVRESISIS